jgi:hypothetical protein
MLSSTAIDAGSYKSAPDLSGCAHRLQGHIGLRCSRVTWEFPYDNETRICQFGCEQSERCDARIRQI